ncbi:hypothetical protein [Zunongwangia sp.]|uniref:hypothetical protein n=1 Tax=Zunongwangia sp. TaxID=1965325 RepID=UPI003AA8D3FA
MLSKGLRDEKNEEIDKIIASLLELGFLPDEWRKIRNILNSKLKEGLGLSFDEIEQLSQEKLMEVLASLKLEASQYESLADVLLNSIPLEAEEKQSDLARKTLCIYQTSQEISKTFSFSLTQKINDARSWTND